MKILIKVKLFITFSMLVSQLLMSAVVFADTSVIVHPGNKAVLNSKDIQRIFLGKMNEFSPGKAATPIDQPFGTKARTEFIEAIIKKPEKQTRAYLAIMLFTGAGIIPREESDVALIKKTVAENQDAIAYIDSALVDASVRVVYTY